MCAMIKTGTFFPVKTIVGKDLDVGATFNADIQAASPVLIPAGRFMVYVWGATGDTRSMRPWTPGAPTNDTAAMIEGILAQDVDSSPSVAPGPVGILAVGMIYKRGTFLLQEIEEANQIVIRPPPALPTEPPAATDIWNILRRKGIFLEESWEGYALMENPPNAATRP